MNLRVWIRQDGVVCLYPQNTKPGESPVFMPECVLGVLCVNDKGQLYIKQDDPPKAGK